MKPLRNHKLLIGNILFVLVGAAILILLFSAPKETTSPLPHDDIHRRFHDIEDKKEAEKFCLDCHDQDKEAALPDGHPPKYRCLFCHKRL
jgi:hypothetical protein